METIWFGYSGLPLTSLSCISCFFEAIQLDFVPSWWFSLMLLFFLKQTTKITIAYSAKTVLGGQQFDPSDSSVMKKQNQLNTMNAMCLEKRS